MPSTMLRSTFYATLGLLASIAFAPTLAGQQVTTAATALRREIERADSTMFAAYNAHDGDQLGRFFAPDLEFYHDTGGVLTWAQAMAGLTSTFTQSADIRRTLVGPIEVYPIRDYGAIEVGVHQFCHREDGRLECGTFKFTHVWRRTATGWQVSRAVSYDH
jgi:ketosteroid isomerase-like protein